MSRPVQKRAWLQSRMIGSKPCTAEEAALSPMMVGLEPYAREDGLGARVSPMMVGSEP